MFLTSSMKSKGNPIDITSYNTVVVSESRIQSPSICMTDDLSLERGICVHEKENRKPLRGQVRPPLWNVFLVQPWAELLIS